MWGAIPEALNIHRNHLSRPWDTGTEVGFPHRNPPLFVGKD